MFSKNILSIDIGNKNIKIAEGKVKNNFIEINKLVLFKTPDNSYENGSFLDFEKIKSEIHNKIIENKIKTKNTICTVNSTKTIIRDIELPFSNKKDLNSLINFEVEEYLPISIEDYFIEYKIIDKYKTDESEKVNILLTALPKVIVNDYFKLLKELHLKPLVLDIHPNSINKLIKVLYQNKLENFSLEQTVCIIDIGHSLTNVNIIDNGIMKLNKIINLGSKDIDINIANTFNLSLEEAEIRKHENAYLKNINKEELSENMLYSASKYVVDDMIYEVQKIFQYYISRKAGNKIDNILLFGGGSNLNGVEEYISNYFNIKTSKINHLETIKYKENNKIELEYYLNALSAFIRE